MNTKTFLGGLLVGGIIVGGFLTLNNTRKNEAELFANKERCAVYTQKRQKEADEKAELLQHSISVEGFYSKVANTCITHSTEIAFGHYMQLTLIDELTGKTEAFAFEATGKELEALSLEGKQEQVKQDFNYHERLRYFQGQK
jgi:hypothetical protein